MTHGGDASAEGLRIGECFHFGAAGAGIFDVLQVVPVVERRADFGRVHGHLGFVFVHVHAAPGAGEEAATAIAEVKATIPAPDAGIGIGQFNRGCRHVFHRPVFARIIQARSIKEIFVIAQDDRTMVVGQRMDAAVNAVEAHRFFPHAVDIEFFVGGDDVMDVDDDALMRPRCSTAAMNVDDIGQGAGGGPSGHDIVVISPGVVGDADLDIRMPLHEAFVVFGLARAEGCLPVTAEGSTRPGPARRRCCSGDRDPRARRRCWWRPSA